jgi:cysteine desulfurase
MNQAAREAWGNPRSVHAAGRRARAALSGAAAQIGDYLGCHPTELSWAPNGTSALRTALGQALARASEGPVVTTRIEHPALIEALRAARLGDRLHELDAPAGRVDHARVGAALADAAVIALSPMNHELGTLISADLVALAPADAIWIIDATQAAVWLELDRWMGPRSFVIASSAKLGGPPGVAVLRTPPMLREHRMHAHEEGTLPWYAAVGMGAACDGRRALREANRLRVCGLARQLLEGLRELDGALLHNADAEAWLGPILNVSFPGIDGKRLEHALDMHGVAIARTSACQAHLETGSMVVSAAFPEPSSSAAGRATPSLSHAQRLPSRAREATRWSLGWCSTELEVERGLEITRAVLNSAR